MKKGLLAIVFLLALFPYNSYGMQSAFDVQPWFAFAACFLLLIDFSKVLSMPRKGYGYCLLMVCLWEILLLLTVHAINDKVPVFNFLRTSYKYVIILLCLFISYYYDFLEQDLYSRLLKCSIIAWALMANIQFILKKPLISFLLPRVSFYYGRNFAIGFAPEPSFFAKMMISMMMLSSFMTYRQKDRIVINILVTECVLLSASLSGILILVLYWALRLINYLIHDMNSFSETIKRLMLVFVSAFGLYLVVAAIMPLISDVNFGRAMDVIRNISHFGMEAILNDESFSRRLIQITNIRYIFNYGLVQGVGIPEYPSGGLFGIVYESGVLGFMLVCMIIILTIGTAIRHQRKQRFGTLANMLMIVLLIFTDTAANPIYWLLWFSTIKTGFGMVAASRSTVA